MPRLAGSRLHPEFTSPETIDLGRVAPVEATSLVRTASSCPWAWFRRRHADDPGPDGAARFRRFPPRFHRLIAEFVQPMNALGCQFTSPRSIRSSGTPIGPPGEPVNWLTSAVKISSAAHPARNWCGTAQMQLPVIPGRMSPLPVCYGPVFSGVPAALARPPFRWTGGGGLLGIGC